MPNPYTRRALLRGALMLTGAAVATGLAGCDPFSSGAPGTAPSHDLDGFLAETVALRERYQAAITAVPELAGVLTPVHDAHQAHAEALAAALGRQVPAPSGAPPAPGTTRAAAVSALAAAEKAARDRAVAACLASTGRLAPLLGCIAAARASHLEVVR